MKTALEILLKARKLGLTANPHLRKTNVSTSYLL